MFDRNPSPLPTSGAPLPPWQSAPRSNPVAPRTPVVPPPSPTAPVPGGLQAAPPPAAQEPVEPKQWGPLKPIRPVPKPSEEKMAFVLAQTEHVVDTDRESRQKRWVIIGSVTGILVVVGGTLAFIFFGRNEGPTLPANQAVILVNTNKAKNTNVTANAVFPEPNVNSANNLNQAANTNAAAPDADSDGLSDADEARYGTSTTKPDTDGDGFTDGEEVKNGYNPIGAGKL